jgi:hypothetical protein
MALIDGLDEDYFYNFFNQTAGLFTGSSFSLDMFTGSIPKDYMRTLIEAQKEIITSRAVSELPMSTDLASAAANMDKLLDDSIKELEGIKSRILDKNKAGEKFSAADFNTEILSSLFKSGFKSDKCTELYGFFVKEFTEQYFARTDTFGKNLEPLGDYAKLFGIKLVTADLTGVHDFAKEQYSVYIRGKIEASLENGVIPGDIKDFDEWVATVAPTTTVTPTTTPTTPTTPTTTPTTTVTPTATPTAAAPDNTFPADDNVNVTNATKTLKSVILPDAYNAPRDRGQVAEGPGWFESPWDYSIESAALVTPLPLSTVWAIPLKNWLLADGDDKSIQDMLSDHFSKDSSKFNDAMKSFIDSIILNQVSEKTIKDVLIYLGKNPVFANKVEQIAVAVANASDKGKELVYNLYFERSISILPLKSLEWAWNDEKKKTVFINLLQSPDGGEGIKKIVVGNINDINKFYETNKSSFNQSPNILENVEGHLGITEASYKKTIIEDYSATPVTKNLFFKVIDTNHVWIGRTTSREAIVIYKEPNGNWNLPDDLMATGGYDTLEQAIAMANLANRTTEWLKKESLEGGSNNPFEVSYGGDIEFDVNWKPFIERNVFENDSSKLDFYIDDLKIEKGWIVNLLNRTYKRYKG